MAELPPIDLVLISHDHYDHLDAPTVDRLTRDGRGGSMRFVVPLGLKRWFTSRGIDRVTELDWWEGTSFGGVRVTAVPVQHWSKRRLFEGFRTLWAGYVVEASGIIFLFVGDTGYSPLLGESARRLGPIDLLALPIGAYAPRWFMKPYHMTPEEAVKVHLDLGGPPTVALHWGTFALADEPLDEPPRRLRQELSRRGIGEERFRVLEHGQSLPLAVLLDRGRPTE